MTANVLNQKRDIVGGFNVSSTSYVDMLDQTGGNTTAVTLTKAAGTDILITGASHGFNGSVNDTLILGVNDGTTDYDLGATRSFSTSGRITATGSRLITGLGAGTFTFKLRGKRTAASGSWGEGSGDSNFITAVECNNGALAGAATAVLAAGNVTFSSTSYVDLLDNVGGSVISVSITKVSGATTDLFVRGTLSLLGAVTADTVTLGVSDGTTTTDLGRTRGDGTPYFQIVGMVVLTGLAAGSYALKLRVKTNGGQTQQFNNGVNSASLSVLEIPV